MASGWGWWAWCKRPFPDRRRPGIELPSSCPTSCVPQAMVGRSIWKCGSGCSVIGANGGAAKQLRSSAAAMSAGERSTHDDGPYA